VAGNLNDLADFIDGLNVKIPVATNEIKKSAGRVILQDLTQVTPADTGAAISNWQASSDEPNIAVVPPYAPSPRGRMINGVWTHSADPTATAQANAPATVDAGEFIIDAIEPGHPLFITNNVPYIGVLNDGSSTQTPAGFVDRALILARSVIDRAKLLL
jgi:hypothetical protein